MTINTASVISQLWASKVFFWQKKTSFPFIDLGKFHQPIHVIAISLQLGTREYLYYKILVKIY